MSRPGAEGEMVVHLLSPECAEPHRVRPAARVKGDHMRHDRGATGDLFDEQPSPA